jgi:uncharacterized membrane protein
MTALPSRPRRLHHRWLLVLPFVWQVALTPAVNGVRFAPLHVPFPMWWQMAGIVFTTVIIAIVFRLDRRSGALDAEMADELDSEPLAGAGAR